MKYDNEKLKEKINTLSIPDGIKKEKMIDFINDYLSGLTDSELGNKYGVSGRTVRSWLKELRDYKIVPYRVQFEEMKQSKSDNQEEVQEALNELVKHEPENSANINKAELIKLLNIHGSRTAVAKELGISFNEVDDLVDYYKILDNKTLSTKLNTILNGLLKDCDVKSPKIKIKSSGTSIGLLLSDWHVGKTIKDENGKEIYNVKIFRNRVDILIKQILKIIDRHMQSHLDVEEFVIFAVGDFANGDNVYPTQAYEQDAAPPKQVMEAVYAFMKVIKAIMDRGISVKFYGVYGNHGRAPRKDSDPLANWDLMIYKILQFWKQTDNVKGLNIAYSEREYLNENVRNWTFHLRHKAYYQDETAAGDSKFKGWKELHSADMILSGHYHHWAMNERKIMGGSLCGHDDLSERMATSTGEPSQVIWAITNKYSHTNIFPIRVKEEE